MTSEFPTAQPLFVEIIYPNRDSGWTRYGLDHYFYITGDLPKAIKLAVRRLDKIDASAIYELASSADGKDRQLNETEIVRLVRFPLNGGGETMLNFPGVRLAESPIAANAIRTDGLILKSLAVSSWDWAPAVLDPNTGKVERISLPSALDVHYPMWAPDGRILLFGLLDEGTLWRFKADAPLR